MKKRVAVLLCILVFSVMIAANAALADGSAALDNNIRFVDGRTVISWTTTGGFSSFYVLMEADNGYAVQTLWRLGETTRTSLTTAEMMPGKTYRIILTDQDFNTLDERYYTVPEPAIFEDGKLKSTSVKITLEPRRLLSSESSAKKINSFSADTIMNGLERGTETYAMKYHMKMPMLKNARSFFVTVYIEAPNGYLDCILAEEIEFSRVNGGYQELWYDFLGGYYFESLYDANYEVPFGEYTVWTFWDGMYVNDTQFKVNP